MFAGEYKYCIVMPSNITLYLLFITLLFLLLHLQGLFLRTLLIFSSFCLLFFLLLQSVERYCVEMDIEVAHVKRDCILVC
jgi:hypothetical protein